MSRLRYQHLRSYEPGKVPAPDPTSPGELAVNITDRQLFLRAADGTAVPLLALRQFDDDATYGAGDLVHWQHTIWVANAPVAAGPFDPDEWSSTSVTQIQVGPEPPPAPVQGTCWFNTGTNRLLVRVNGQWLSTNAADRILRAGDTMTGTLVLAGDPGAPLDATPKRYVDAQVQTVAAQIGPLSAAISQLGTGAIYASGGDMDGPLSLSSYPGPNDAVPRRFVEAQFYVGDSPPTNPAAVTWFRSDIGRLFVKYGAVWVDAAPATPVDESRWLKIVGGTVTGATVFQESVDFRKGLIAQGYAVGQIQSAKNTTTGPDLAGYEMMVEITSRVITYWGRVELTQGNQTPVITLPYEVKPGAFYSAQAIGLGNENAPVDDAKIENIKAASRQFRVRYKGTFTSTLRINVCWMVKGTLADNVTIPTGV